jgi:PEP-CTERM motif
MGGQNMKTWHPLSLAIWFALSPCLYTPLPALADTWVLTFTGDWQDTYGGVPVQAYLTYDSTRSVLEPVTQIQLPPGSGYESTAIFDTIPEGETPTDFGVNLSNGKPFPDQNFDSSGNWTALCGTGPCFTPLPEASRSAVPEPATWAMMLLGFLGLGFAFRRSRRRVPLVCKVSLV